MSEPKIKLDNSKSRFGKKSEENKATQAQFEGEISEHQKAQKAVIENISKLTGQFIKFIKDKTLNENKGPILSELEKSLPKELVELSLKIDNDETTDQICLGSNGLLLLLLRTSLIQRDIINELSYKVSKLENQLSSQTENDGK